jgi:hypothetical protein
LPNGLIALIPYLLFGLLAAYNTVVLASYLLTGYAAYRLVRYTLTRHARGQESAVRVQETGDGGFGVPVAAFLGA